MSRPPRDEEPIELPAAMRRRAAEWLALREARGFTAEEHADFADWIEADWRHPAAFAEVAAGWSRLDALAAYPHSADAAPDPDLLQPETSKRRWTVPLAVAAAAAIAIAAGLRLQPWDRDLSAGRSSVVQVAPRVLQLSDGSEVEVNAGGEVTEHFTAAERRVWLVRGEAHFTVAKNREWPFIVEAGGVRLRAVGTAFNVRLEPAGVEVLVTHGRVQVEAPGATEVTHTGSAAPVLERHQRLSVPLGSAAITPVETLESSDVNRLLAWQTSRIAFENSPLAEVLERFQSKPGTAGAPRITIADPRLAALRISGRVRGDDVAGLLEVLEASFGVASDRRPDGEIVLRLR